MNTEATYSYINQFFSGALDPTWPHILLIGGTILGGALVGLGVILEAHKIFSIPTGAVFVGIVVEAACTLLLFGFDEGISSAQKSIIDAQLRKIIELEPRGLNVAQRKVFSERLKPFAGRTVTVQSFAMDAESYRLGYEILIALKDAGINPVDSRGSLTVNGPGMRFGIDVTNPSDAAEFGLVLASSIMAASDNRVAVRHLAMTPAPDVRIFVGLKPVPGVDK